MQPTKLPEVVDTCPVCATGRRGYAQLLEGPELTLQSHICTARMGVGASSASGARLLNLWN